MMFPFFEMRCLMNFFSASVSKGSDAKRSFSRISSSREGSRLYFAVKSSSVASPFVSSFGASASLLVEYDRTLDPKELIDVLLVALRTGKFRYEGRKGRLRETEFLCHVVP